MTPFAYKQPNYMTVYTSQTIVSSNRAGHDIGRFAVYIHMAIVAGCMMGLFAICIICALAPGKLLIFK